MQQHDRDFDVAAYVGLPAEAEPPIDPPLQTEIPDHIAGPDFGTHGQPAPKSTERFNLEMLDDIEVDDDPVELVQGILPMGGALHILWPAQIPQILQPHSPHAAHCSQPIFLRT